MEETSGTPHCRVLYQHSRCSDYVTMKKRRPGRTHPLFSHALPPPLPNCQIPQSSCGSDPAFANPAAWSVLGGYSAGFPDYVARLQKSQEGAASAGDPLPGSLTELAARCPPVEPPPPEVLSLIMGDLWPNSLLIDAENKCVEGRGAGGREGAWGREGARCCPSSWEICGPTRCSLTLRISARIMMGGRMGHVLLLTLGNVTVLGQAASFRALRTDAGTNRAGLCLHLHGVHD